MSEPVEYSEEGRTPKRAVEPLDLSVITSWWTKVPNFEEKASAEIVDPKLPSLVETLEAGIGVIDYYYFPQGELRHWRKILGLGSKSPASAVHRRLISLKLEHYELSRQIRTHFSRSPIIGTRSGIRAIATNAVDIGQGACLAKEFLGCSNDDTNGLLETSIGATVPKCAFAGQGQCPNVGPGIVCGLCVIAAALRLAVVSGATVVEMVGGPAGRQTSSSTTPGKERQYYDFLPVVEAQAKEWDILGKLASKTKKGCVGPLSLGPQLAREQEKEWKEANWFREKAPSPVRILAWNLFVLARFILTKLPPTDDPFHPPVSLALEIEPGAVYWLNSIRRYDEVIACYRELVKRYVSTLRSPDDLREFRHFGTLPSVIDAATENQLIRLFGRCVGLNVDIGHMLLTGTHPCEVAPLCELGIEACRGEYCPLSQEMRNGPRRARDAENCPWREYPETLWKGRIESILHYHLSDQHLVHYCDLPPGERHAKAEFLPWIQQAFALRQLSTGDGETQGNPAGDLRDLRRHPNYTGCIALELEASPGGGDQIVTAYALANRWIQDVMQNTGIKGFK